MIESHKENLIPVRNLKQIYTSPILMMDVEGWFSFGIQYYITNLFSDYNRMDKQIQHNLFMIYYNVLHVLFFILTLISLNLIDI
jgi:hypothetical protein